MTFRSAGLACIIFAAGGLALAACSPTVKLQAPEEPIRFDVNINITEQKRLEIDRELLELIRRNPSLFGLSPEEIPDSPSGSQP